MNRIALFAAKLAIMMSLVEVLTAQEFRVETEVFRAGERQPISTSLTLCESGLIYDFILSEDKNQFADEIAIFDTREREFILLDVNQKIRTTIPEHQLIRMLSALKSKGVLKNEFMVNPEFQEHFDLSSGWLTLTGPMMTYRAKGEIPADGTRLPMYNEFLDQFARLKVTDPRGMPPFARMELNAAIKKYKFIPSEIELKLNVGEGKDVTEIQLISKHNIDWRLSDQDREQIKLTKNHWMAFAVVDLNEFRGLDISVDEVSHDE